MIVARRYAGAAKEAGVNPALPRNCKRGHGERPLGTIFTRRLKTWEGRTQKTD